MPTTNKTVGYATGVASAVLMGLMGIYVRNIESDGQTIAFARLGGGLVFLAAFMLATGALRGIARVRFSVFLPLSGFMMAANVLCYINAIGSTTLANAAFILYLAPLIAAGLAAFLPGERFGRGNALLLMLSFLGFVLLTGLQLSADVSYWQGYAWGLGAAVCYALFIVFNRKIPEAVPPLVRSLHQFFFGALLLVPFLEGSVLRSLTPSDIVWLTGVGLVQGFVALSLLVIAIRHLRAVEYGTISYLEPLTAAVIGYALYAEHLTTLQVAGCTVILLAGMLQLRSSRRPTKPVHRPGPVG